MNDFLRKLGIDILCTTVIGFLLVYWFGFNPLSILKEIVIYYIVMGVFAVAGGLALIYALQKAMNPKSPPKQEQ